MNILTAAQAKQARASLGLSQAFVAKSIGIDRPLLSNFERSVVVLNDEILSTLRNFYLAEGESQESPPAAVAVLYNEPEVTPEDLPTPDESGNRFVHGVRVFEGVSDERAAEFGKGLDDIEQQIGEVLGAPVEADGWSIFAQPNEESQAKQNRLRLLMARGYCVMLSLQGVDAIAPCTVPVAEFKEGGINGDQCGWLSQAFGDLFGFLDPSEDPEAPTERTDLNWIGLGRVREPECLGCAANDDASGDVDAEGGPGFGFF